MYDAEHGERHVELTRRVSALEKRVAELEAAVKQQSEREPALGAESAKDQAMQPGAGSGQAAPPQPRVPQYPGARPRLWPEQAAAQVSGPPVQAAGDWEDPRPAQYPGWQSGRASQPGWQSGRAPQPGWQSGRAPQPGWQGAGAPTTSLVEQLGISIGSLRDLESRLTGRLLAWVGAAAVVLGAVFFLSLAFSRGWIGPEARVAIALAGGAISMALGAWLPSRNQEQLGNVLVAVGLGVVSLGLFAGTRLYGLFPPEAALAGSFVAALCAALIAVRHDSETVAVFGLVAVVAAPPILGASANITTVLFLGLTLVGTTAIALVRSWRWLPPVAFSITAPQVVAWLVGGPQAGLAVAILGGYWLLHALAASADELRAEQARVEGRAEILFTANSVLAVGGGLYVLGGGFAVWQGAFVAAAALAQFAFGGYFVWRRGDRYPFGMLVNAIGIAFVALAIERQFDGPPVAVAWALEALILAAIYRLRRHEYAGWAAILIAVLPVAHLCWYEYPIRSWALQGVAHSNAIPFVDPAGLTFGCLLAAALTAAWLSRHHDARCALVTACLLLVAYALPFELSGLALLAGWALIVPAAVAAEGLLDRLPSAPSSRAELRTRPIIEIAEPQWPDSPFVATVVAACLAGAHILAVDGPIGSSTVMATPAVPFTDLVTASAAVGLASLLASAWLTARPDLRVGAILVATALAAYVAFFELATPFAIAAWCGLALPIAVCSIRDAYGRPAYLVGAAALIFGGLAITLAQVVPVDRLGVRASVPTTGLWFAIDAVCAIGAIAAAAAVGAVYLPIDRRIRQGIALATAAALVYLLSALLVGLFQGRVGGSIALEEIQKQAQVGVSILWALIGMGVFVAGIVGWRQLVRETGLALLAMATGKVFIFDLSYLDVAYRVLSLMGLGVLLLGGAYVYQMLRPRRPDSGDTTAG